MMTTLHVKSQINTLILYLHIQEFLRLAKVILLVNTLSTVVNSHAKWEKCSATVGGVFYLIDNLFLSDLLGVGIVK